MRRHTRGEEGFGLVEMVVAVTLLGIVLFGTLRGAITSMTSASIAKERSVASSLASGAIAQALALPFSSLEAGLNPSVDALCSDPNITATSCSTGPFTLTLNGAQILASNTSTSQSPLVPHITTVTEGIPYQVASYPTASGTTGLVTVVVVVSWQAPTGGTLKVVGETEVAAP